MKMIPALGPYVISYSVYLYDILDTIYYLLYNAMCSIFK